MDREEFIDHIERIMFHEGHQMKKGQNIASSIIVQRRAVNAIAKALGIDKLTSDEVKELGYGN